VASLYLKHPGFSGYLRTVAIDSLHFSVDLASLLEEPAAGLVLATGRVKNLPGYWFEKGEEHMQAQQDGQRES
jgi:hypothetical protein